MHCKRRVVVTGIGVIAPNGIGKEQFWQSNSQGISGVDYITNFNTDNFDTKIAGQIKNFNPVDYVQEKTAKRVDRFVHFGLSTAQMALDDSKLNLEKENKERIGVIIGSGLGGILYHEEQILYAQERGSHKMNPLGIPRVTPNAVSSYIAIEHGLLGINYVVSTACASGTNAIGEAFRKIQYNEADIIFSGGVEAPLTEFTFGAFYSLRILSKQNDNPAKASRPFDKKRDGFVIAEGGAILVLEELDHALKRGAHIYAEMKGYGIASGAYHIAMPQPDGIDASRTIALALSDAQLNTNDIDYINAHGTSTTANDIAETKAIKLIFKERAYKIPISSTKSMIGHSIGAAGAIEAVVSCMVIEKQSIPPTINYEEKDQECDLDFVPNIARKSEVNTVLSNSFGFGSINAVIIFNKFSNKNQEENNG